MNCPILIVFLVKILAVLASSNAADGWSYCARQTKFFIPVAYADTLQYSLSYKTFSQSYRSPIDLIMAACRMIYWNS